MLINKRIIGSLILLMVALLALGYLSDGKYSSFPSNEQVLYLLILAIISMIIWLFLARLKEDNARWPSILDIEWYIYPLVIMILLILFFILLFLKDIRIIATDFSSTLFYIIVILAACPIIKRTLRIYRASPQEHSKKKFSVITVRLLIIVIVLSLAGLLGAEYPTTFTLRYCPALAELLIRHNIEMDTYDAIGRTPFGVAIEKGNVEAIRLLLEKGADIESTIEYDEWMSLGPSSWTPLGLAVKNDNMSVIQLLLEKRADINRQSTDIYGTWTPLCLAVKNNNSRVVKVLIEKGADMNRESLWRYSDAFTYTVTPLTFAGVNGFNDMVVLLLKSGADVNHRSSGERRTALMEACWSPEATLETIKILVDNNADVNLRDENGMTALSIADKEEIKSFLISKGAVRNKPQGGI